MKKYMFVFIACIFFLESCKEDFFDQVIDVDIPEHTPALAVTSNLSNVDTLLWVYVSSSVGILVEEDPAEITDAQVELFKNGELLYTFPYLERSMYAWQVTEPLGNEAADYELKVAKSGFEPVSAVQTMPGQVDIVSATYEEDGTVNPDGERVDELLIEFDDPKNVTNYYKIKANLEFTGDDGESYVYDIYFDSFDPSIVYTNDGLYLSDGVFDGERYELRLWSYNIPNDEFMNDPRIAVNLINVSEDRYFREASIDAYENAENNPFAEPAVIFSNIENGHGIFSLEAKGPTFYLDL